MQPVSIATSAEKHDTCPSFHPRSRVIFSCPLILRNGCLKGERWGRSSEFRKPLRARTCCATNRLSPSRLSPTPEAVAVALDWHQLKWSSLAPAAGRPPKPGERG